MNFDELHRLIMSGENAGTEFKEQLSQEVLQGLSTDIAALANSQGGRVIFGVTDAGDPVGCDLRGDEGEQISQAASNCRPAIRIDIEQIPFGKKQFLVVHVPRSAGVHSDVYRKFPQRIGNITDYLDGSGLAALMRERSQPLSETTPPFYGTVEERRKPLPEPEEKFVIRALNSKESAVRKEVLADLSYINYQYILLENNDIVKGITAILESAKDDERAIALDCIRGVVFMATGGEKKNLESWFGLIAQIAKTSPDLQLARRAFEVLRTAEDPAIVDILIHWTEDADDNTFAGLNPSGIIQGIRDSDLKRSIREALYALVERNSDDGIRKRATGILDRIRQR